MVQNCNFLYIIFSKNYFLNGNHKVFQMMSKVLQFPFTTHPNSCQYPLINYLNSSGRPCTSPNSNNTQNNISRHHAMPSDPKYSKTLLEIDEGELQSR